MPLRALFDRVLSWLTRHEEPVTLRPANDGSPPPAPAGTWCLVGNVVDEHAFGEAHETRRGSKQFSPGTKVYCLPPAWGDGFENVIAIGIARRPRRWITVVMPSALIANWRAKRVFEPPVLRRLTRGFDGHAGRWGSRAEVEDFAARLRTRRVSRS